MAQNDRRYDLEDRTLAFAKQVMAFVRSVHQDIPNQEVSRQLPRSAGSVGANYIEANEALSRKDFHYRIKICRKEAKESRYRLNLIAVPRSDQDRRREELIQEATELMNIFGAIHRNTKCS